MPRKTNVVGGTTLASIAASMRPRPDAAENEQHGAGDAVLLELQ